MNRPYIEFRQQRDFGAILSVTFGFLRNEFKPFMKAIINIAGPAMIVYLASSGFYTYTSGDIFAFGSFDQPSLNSGNLLISLVSLFVYFVSGLTVYVLGVSSTLYYIKSYIDNKGIVNIDKVKKNVYSTFWSFTGMSILKVITLIFAMFLCILPVFYAIIPMAVFYSIYVFESRYSPTDAYGKSFSLINEDFWTVFGTFCVFVIIYFVLQFLLALPVSIYGMVKTGIFSGQVDPGSINDLYTDPILLFFNVIATLFQYLTNLILVIGGAVLYFHLNEKRNFTGTYERISNIGGHIEK